MRKRKRKQQNKVELDLHTVKHADVEEMVEDFVLDNQCEMLIITGHSDEMKRIVSEVLDLHDFSYVVGLPGNDGVIHVSG